MDYQLLVLMHVLIAGYWLGGDLGVFHIAGKISDASASADVRKYSVQSMLLLDMIPKSCMILALATGSLLAARLGILPAWGGWVLVPFALSWLILVWAGFLQGHGSTGAWMARVDWWIRVLVFASCVIFAVDALSIGLLSQAPAWLAFKVLLFAGIVLMGLVVRVQLRPLGPLFGRVAAGNATVEDEDALARLIARVKIPVLAIWCMIVLISLLGALKVPVGM